MAKSSGGRKPPTRAERRETSAPPRHLADMRRVYAGDDVENDTPAQMPMRKMKLENFEGFLKQLNQYEKDFAEECRRRRADYRLGRKANAERRALEPKKEAAGAGPDDGTVAALELIEKVLREAK
jgi:hypothetical protein